jgi:uncharacterized protein DUF5916/cellulose/xylan binding protein with CBM9 domain
MPRCCRYLFSGMLALVLVAPSLAQTSRPIEAPKLEDPSVFTPNVSPVLAPRAREGAIRIDGDLTDAGWTGADRAVNFSETFPGDQTRPPIGIEVWTTYDESAVYFAFIIEDDPDAVRVNMSDRDTIWQDDYVGVILDTYSNSAWAYFIASNPIGIQGDTRLGGGNEDVGFDIIFQSNGKLTETGYQVEMAVPFRSLRFPDTEVKDWNINFWITHPRDTRNTYSWSAIDRDDPCWLCQMGTVNGLRGVSPSGKFEFLPALTGSQVGSLPSFSDPTVGLDNGRVNTDPSFGAKYSFSSNLVADVAVNPDFSQIESDAAQVDVNSTFALFFPERRPFFQEGSDLFDTPIQTVYTRSINNPSAATKVTGRFGDTNFSYVGGLDEDSPIILPFEERSRFVQAGKSYSNLLRVKQNFGTNSYVGALLTDRRFTGNEGAGSTFGVDANLRLTQTVSFQGQFSGSYTVEPTDSELSEQVGDFTFDNGKYSAALDGESFGGWASSLSLRRNSRHMYTEVSHTATNPTFRAANGFITQNNTQQTFLFSNYTFFFEDKFIQRISPDVIAGYWWNFDGQRKDEFLWTGVRVQMKGQTNLGVRLLLVSNERFAGQDFRGLRRVQGNFNSNFSELLQAGGFVGYGRAISRNASDPVMGRSMDMQVRATVKPTSRLSFQPTFTYSRLENDATGDEIFAGYILRNRTNYQFTKRLFVRVITQYNDFSKSLEIDPLVTYKVNPFTAVYFGSTHDFLNFDQRNDGLNPGFYQTQRQVFFKLQYLFRV